MRSGLNFSGWRDLCKTHTIDSLDLGEDVLTQGIPGTLLLRDPDECLNVQV